MAAYLWMALVLCMQGWVDGARAEEVATSPPGNRRDRTVLWQIGEFDGKADDLSPHGDFAHDPFYVVGLSTPEKDWPRRHTGPLDLWAGGRARCFTVCFHLSAVPAQGDATLHIATVDCYLLAPELTIRVNGKEIARHQIPWGAPFIKPRDYPGYAHACAIDVPGERLRVGENRIDIVTSRGSFLIYDALRLEAAPGFKPGAPRAGSYVRALTAPQLLLEREGRRVQPVLATVHHWGPSARAALRLAGSPPRIVALKEGRQVFECLLPAVDVARDVELTLDPVEAPPLTANTRVLPVREWKVHLLHFTHLDIGYTHTQEEVERRQIEFLDRAQELIRRSADYPPAARFRWLPEALWAVESYLNAADADKRKAFLDCVRTDRISLCATYANELTGLCSEEELYRVLDYAVRLRREHDLCIDAAMITDVPGCTWGMVTALADCGVRYLSMGPNPNHRIGGTRCWDNRPFYWVSPCGTRKVLCWMSPGYGWFRSGAGDRPIAMFKRSPLLGYLRKLEIERYPYALVNLRYDVRGDNGHPDPDLPAAVKKWNETYLSPRLILSTPHRVFGELEARHGKRLPSVRGDFTPYWEDGAASTAAEAGLNRRSVERLVQAETLWAMLGREDYPAARFDQAWRRAILYDEHTWGSWNSVSEPDAPFTVQQARYKKQLALDADRLSRKLVEDALAERRATGGPVGVIEVFNTLSWPRTDLIVVPKTLHRAGECVRSEAGERVPSQRLAGGELAFLARNVPALGSARFLFEPGPAPGLGAARGAGTRLSNGLLAVDLDEETGAIRSLRARGIDAELVDRESGRGLNEYLYIAGRTPENPKRVLPGSVELRIVDRGPLVVTAELRSSAPGAERLIRQVRLVDGLARVDLSNRIDKRAVREKEAVFFAFPFAVPDCEVRLDMPWAVVRPEKDQIAGAGKNFFAIQRWVDASGRDHGVTLATIDAPLVQMGAIRTDVLDDRGWLEHITPSPRLFSYVMNNYWETNYKAYQEGLVRLDYSIRPHRGRFNPLDAQRFGLERHRPLIVLPARRDGPAARPPALHLDAPGVLLTALAPARDGSAWLARLFAAAGKPERVRLRAGSGPETRRVYRSAPDGRKGLLIEGPLELPAGGVATLRLE